LIGSIFPFFLIRRARLAIQDDRKRGSVASSLCLAALAIAYAWVDRGNRAIEASARRWHQDAQSLGDAT
jgi:peptidoglycan/LPS O-acetylase OafA/YrhL